MVNVKQILTSKGSDVWKVGPDESVLKALKIMADRNIGALLVMDQGELLGIFSERDYARKIILLGKTSEETPVRDVMTSEVVCVALQTTMVECMEIMTDGRFRHLPVKENGDIIGVISIGDVVKSIISDQEFTIKQLENYITGHPKT